MDKAKSVLAEEVLVEKRIITYRYLSRAVNIPVNAAKRALLDFHKTQNAKAPGAVHATYLLYGTKTQDAVPGAGADVDVSMEDADTADAGYLLDEPVPTVSLTLVAEEHLEEALAHYATLDAIHVYSLSADPVADLQVLADATRQLRDLRGSAADADPTPFGVIPNARVWRRQRKTPLPAAPSAKPAKAAAATPAADTANPGSIWNRKKDAAAPPEKSEAKDTKADAKTSASDEAPGAMSIWDRVAKKKSGGAESSAAAAAEGATTAAAATTPAAPKRAGGGGGIMQAFAKGAAAAAAKPKKPAPPAKKEEEDTAMALSDEDAGSDDDDAGLIIPKAQVVTGGKTRRQREEELRKMMEEDDDDNADEEKEEDDDDDDDDDKNEEDERDDVPMEDAVVDAAPDAPAAAKPDEPGEVVTSSTGDGRRRGKRRVMKKKMVQDADGYLVTIQEPAWESFSEDEAPPKPTAAAPAVAAKPKKPAPKTGQGNIMSFFAKK